MKPKKINKYHKNLSNSRYKITDFFLPFAISGIFVLGFAIMMLEYTLINGWIITAIFIGVGVIFTPYFYKYNNEEVKNKPFFNISYNDVEQLLSLVFMEAFCGCGGWAIFLLLVVNSYFSIPDTSYQVKLAILDKGIDKRDGIGNNPVYAYVQIGERMKLLTFSDKEEKYLKDYQYVSVEIQQGRLGFWVIKKKTLLRN